MNALRRIFSRSRSLFRTQELDAEMDEEMRFHIVMRTRQNIEAGMSSEQARYAALRQFGTRRNNMRSLILFMSLALATAGTATLVGYSRQARADRLVNEMLSGDRCLDLQMLRQMGPQVMPPLIKALSAKSRSNLRHQFFFPYVC